MMGVGLKGLAQAPEATAAITYWAPSVAKWAGTTVEEIRAVLDRLDGIRF